ncbi:hypothetical protein Clacol_003623 [Clathrus columnatus]|uniref:BAR-domain-containing protein n=1 Tax=Clathrus columnatus TaxID=1419009 RepID=A0AAV5A8Q8_9AGAM|nr:hypothetical protein Clacol_003623 [Clathrus columnatus]
MFQGLPRKDYTQPAIEPPLCLAVKLVLLRVCFQSTSGKTRTNGISETTDPEFDEYNRKFTAMEGALEKFLKDTKVYSDNVVAMLQSGQQWAIHFKNIFSPLSGEINLSSNHPEAENTLENAGFYQAVMEELKELLTPELELIQSRIHAPAKELQGIMKQIRKSITKRDHKLTDFDRFNNSLTKLRDKKEKSLSDEKNLFKLEQDFEAAANEYEHYNNLLKTELPAFMTLATNFIAPHFQSFCYMQLNIYYLMIEKLRSFADGKLDIPDTAAEIVSLFEERRGDVGERVDSLATTKRVVSTAKLMAARSGETGISRTNTTASAASSTTSSFVKKAPSPPTFSPAAPPPYSSSVNNAAAAATKRPPPPPPLKPKPKAVQYVVALYDFQAQADGDLDFKTGDRIELVERTPSQEDWWTGKLNGRQGVFPGK